MKWLLEPYKGADGRPWYPGPIPIYCPLDAILLVGGVLVGAPLVVLIAIYFGTH